MREGEKRAKRALIGLWADGADFTSYAIAKATAGIVRSKALSATAVRSYFARWQKEGTAELQEAAKRRGSTAWRFLWGPEDGTLGDVLVHAFDVFSSADRRKLTTALRPFLGLSRGASEERIVEEARRFTAEDLYGLADLVQTHAEQGGLAGSTASGYRSVVKRALEVAGEADKVAIVFPRIWEETPWEAALYRWFRTPQEALVDEGTLRIYETYLRRCGEVVSELLDGIPPEELTVSALDEVVLPHIHGVLCKPSLPSSIRSAFRYVAKVHKEGPYAGVSSRPCGGRGREGYLYAADGSAGTGDPEAFLRILAENGFDDDVVEFFRWYFEYSTLSEDEFWLRDDEFPARPPKRVLSEGTVMKRLIAARAFFYQAVIVAREKGTPLDLSSVLGTNGVATAKRVEMWWWARADAGEVSSRSSWGLEDLLKSIGMIARAAFDRWLHEQGQPTEKDGEPLPTSDIRRGLGDQPAAERSYWKLYEHCSNRMSAIEEKRRKSGEGHVATDIKDIRRIYRETPPAYWVRIQDRLLGRIASWDRDKAYDYHRQVMLAFLNGLLLSTGVRISEPAWLRIGKDGGYSEDRRSDRLLVWDPWMRKNEKRHSAHLRERFCPAWLEDLYLNSSRVFFMDRGLKRGTLDARHDFLMVRPSDGRSWSKGLWPETEEERRDCHARIAPQVGAIRKSWQSLLAGIAAELGMTWPTFRGEGAPHAIRNTMGYGVFLALGEEKAAHYLGDSVESVRETYMSTDGVHVDASDLDVQLVEAVSVPKEPSDDRSELLDRIRELEEEIEDLRTGARAHGTGKVKLLAG